MDDDLEPTSLVRELSVLMEHHDVPFDTYKEWVSPYGKLPGMRATWYPEKNVGRLNVDVLLDGGEIIHECFAGAGTADAGKADGFRNFLINSFHVLLAAFWGKNHPGEVTTEHWQIGEKPYTAFIGGLGTRGGFGAEPEIPDGLIESIKSAVKGEPLTRDCYWIRHFFSDYKGKQTFEALLNNENWESGVQALKSIRWSKSNGYYSVRNFMVLRAAPD